MKYMLFCGRKKRLVILIIVALALLAIDNYVTHKSETVTFLDVLLNLFGGVKYGYKLSEDGIPFQFTVFTIGTSVVVGCSLWEDRIHPIRYGEIKKYCIIKFFSHMIDLLVYVTVSIITTLWFCFFSGIIINLKISARVIANVYLKVVPAVLVLVELYAIAAIYIQPALVVFINQLLFIFILFVKGHIPLFDQMMLYRVMTEGKSTNDLVFIMICIIIWFFETSIGTAVLRKNNLIHGWKQF